MGTLRFNDGVNINTDGHWRRLELKDGLYVVGHGNLIPCSDEEEVEKLLAELRQTETIKVYK